MHVSLNIIFSSPLYHDPLISSGISTSSATKDMHDTKLVKLWSHAWRRACVGTIACHPCSAAVTGDCGSPTLILCLSSQQTNSMISHTCTSIAYSLRYQHSGSMGDFSVLPLLHLPFYFKLTSVTQGYT